MLTIPLQWDFKPAHFLLPAKKYMGKLKVIDLNLKLLRILNPDINIINKKQFKIFNCFMK